MGRPGQFDDAFHGAAERGEDDDLPESCGFLKTARPGSRCLTHPILHFFLLRVTRPKRDFMTMLEEARAQCSPDISRSQHSDFHVLSSSSVLHQAIRKPCRLSGSERMRWPVAAKSALTAAGTSVTGPTSP